MGERYSLDDEGEVDALRLPSLSEVTEEEIREGIHTVARMEPVAEITGQEFLKSETDLMTQVERFYNSKGNMAYNSQIGEVTLERKGAKSDIAHGIGRKKAAAFAAVPDVIQSGSVVFYQNDWKGRGYDRAIIAAPIRMGGEIYFEAVVLNRTNGENKFYLHEVRAEKDGAQPFKTGTREGYPSGNAPSIPSILDNLWKVKRQSENEKFSLDDAVEDDDDLSLQPSDSDIRYSVEDESVTETQQFKRWFGDWQNDPGRASKVVNADGTPKVVYHGSQSDFNTFSLKYLGTNGTTEGYGFYFTDSRQIAQSYANGTEAQRHQGANGKLFEVYLDIKKPLSNTQVTISRPQFRKFLMELNNQVDEDGEPLDMLSNYGDVAWEGLNNVVNTAMKAEYDGNDSDVKAMGKNYAPIYTNKNYTKAEFGVFDTTAEGVGNLKGRQYAVNPSYNISAFDAFERHVDQTARFCGMAIPARNWTTLMNWRESNNSTGDVITHKWGEESKRYITDLITTLQSGGDAKSDTISSGLSKLQSNYISAVFGANPSIVLKQLGSIPLAGAYLDARNMPTPAQIAKIDRSLISRYTQELDWRTMGYSTPETKQLKENPNWTQTNKSFKFFFGGGAITAMDGWAASTLWPWAENKVRREHPELDMGTQAQMDAGESAFYKKVAEEFENAVSRSQSVSDEIHQGTLRKSKNPITRTFTMFRSDSAQTYNALRQKIGEARYYMRTGATDKVIRTAKKAAGAAFVALLLNAAWSEAVSFLMALWKNKGKYYRDDEDELTFQSIAGEMVSNMLGSFAGVVTGGEELFELIGNNITGDKWYGIETPGMEQLNDLLDTLIESGSGMRDLVAGGWDILKNGGNLGQYFLQHGNDLLGYIKEVAQTAATYLPGIPVNNIEAYLLGAVKWVAPDIAAGYEGLFASSGKNDLSGLTGDALAGRLGSILSGRNLELSKETVKVLADLYAAGYKSAVPADVPKSISIDGTAHELSPYQQQAYGNIWSGIVADALEDISTSELFANADQETQAKMLARLYEYATAQAKAQLFDDYALSGSAMAIEELKAAGLDLADCIGWATVTSGMKRAEEFAELRKWDMTNEAKQAIVRVQRRCLLV